MGDAVLGAVGDDVVFGVVVEEVVGDGVVVVGDEHMKAKEVRAVPVMVVIPVALLPLVHATDTGVEDAELNPNGPSMAEVVHSVNVSCVTKEPERLLLYAQ